MKWNGWIVAIISYGALILLTAIPLLNRLVRKTKIEAPAIYDDLDHLTETVRVRLRANLKLLNPLVSNWSRLEQIYNRFQFYSLAWTILASVLIPILAQAIDGTTEAKWFLTVVSLHASVILAFNKGLSTDDKVKLYRDAQYDLDDLNRSLAANPADLGKDSEEIVQNYIKELNSIVNTVRVGEDKPVKMPDPTTVTVPTVGKP